MPCNITEGERALRARLYEETGSMKEVARLRGVSYVAISRSLNLGRKGRMGRDSEIGRKYRYGLHPEDVDALLEEFGYRCPWCETPFDDDHPWGVDHCKITAAYAGKRASVRALVHVKAGTASGGAHAFDCNWGMKFRERAAHGDKRAIRYLTETFRRTQEVLSANSWHCP